MTPNESLVYLLFANPITYVTDPEGQLAPLEVIDHSLSNRNGDDTDDGVSVSEVLSGSNPVLHLYLRVPPADWEEVSTMSEGYGVTVRFPEMRELVDLDWTYEGVYDADDYIIAFTTVL